MKIAQIVLIIGLFIVGRFLFSRDSKLLNRILILLVLLIGIISIIQPELTSTVAKKIGIGRGVDLIFYLYILGSLLIFAYLRNKINSLHRSLTELTRQVALLTATKQGKSLQEVDKETIDLRPS